jgi:NodT family efflux transporter outer membrane factor (OMF) lipoprotein
MHPNLPHTGSACQPNRASLLITLAVSLALVGCANPTTRPDASEPALTSSTTAASSPHPWWDDFQDPLLSQLVNQALQANTSIRSAQAAVQQARALRDVSVANAGPNVSLSGSAQRNKTNSTEASNSFTAGLDAKWEADIFGANRATINATEADAQAAQASLRDVQVSMAAEVALAYLQLRGYQAQLAIAQNNLASQQETLQITQWRAQAGLVTSLEVEQAQTAAAQTAAQIPALLTSLAQTRHSLAVLTGQRPLELDALLLPERAVPQANSTVTQQIPAETLRQRADVRAAEYRIRAALARVDAADAARYPSFSLGGSLSLNALTLAGLSNGATLATGLLASVSVPLIDGGAGKSKVLAQEAALEQTRADYQNTVLTALKEVEDALIALKNDRDRLVLLQQAATSARNADLLAQNRFASGLIDFQTVLQTQRSLLSAQDSVASLQAGLGADHVRLVKALGGGWAELP